ncbi:hypothetical protein [Tenacibaculum amylolyticum]|uniref:hypothetical protein n=1 Tax=Tenacibaculum amylolyticum TaxID=104269 RepID=UPI0038B61232
MTYPSLNRYRNVEFLQYMRQVLETVNKEDVSTLLLDEKVSVLTITFNKMNVNYQQAQGSNLTQEIQKLDERRDNECY